MLSCQAEYLVLRKPISCFLNNKYAFSVIWRKLQFPCNRVMVYSFNSSILSSIIQTFYRIFVSYIDIYRIFYVKYEASVTIVAGFCPEFHPPFLWRSKHQTRMTVNINNLVPSEFLNVNVLNLFDRTSRRHRSHGSRRYNKPEIHNVSFDGLLPFVNFN